MGDAVARPAQFHAQSRRTLGERAEGEWELALLAAPRWRRPRNKRQTTNGQPPPCTAGLGAVLSCRRGCCVGRDQGSPPSAGSLCNARESPRVASPGVTEIAVVPWQMADSTGTEESSHRRWSARDDCGAAAVAVQTTGISSG